MACHGGEELFSSKFMRADECQASGFVVCSGGINLHCSKAMSRAGEGGLYQIQVHCCYGQAFMPGVFRKTSHVYEPVRAGLELVFRSC